MVLVINLPEDLILYPEILNGRAAYVCVCVTFSKHSSCHAVQRLIATEAPAELQHGTPQPASWADQHHC